MKLVRDRGTGAYYTEDRLFKIQRCTGMVYGWEISKRGEDGEYRIETTVATLPEARKLVIGKGDREK